MGKAASVDPKLFPLPLLLLVKFRLRLVAVNTSSDADPCLARVRGRRGGVGGAAVVLDRLSSGEGVERNGNEGGVPGVSGRGLKISVLGMGVDPCTFVSDLEWEREWEWEWNATSSWCSRVMSLLFKVKA